MSDNLFMIAASVAIVFFLIKFIEMRFINEELKPLKIMIRDTLIVYVSSVFGLYVIQQFKDISIPEAVGIPPEVKVPIAFVDPPGF